jgi:hypothetical protein
LPSFGEVTSFLLSARQAALAKKLLAR